MSKTIKLVLFTLLLVCLLQFSSGDIGACVEWCNEEFKRCVNNVAETMPMDESPYEPCDKDWERCEENCHSTD